MLWHSPIHPLIHSSFINLFIQSFAYSYVCPFGQPSLQTVVFHRFNYLQHCTRVRGSFEVLHNYQ